MNAPMVRVTGLTYTYPSSTAPVLRDVDLEIAEGELLLVAGPSGSGKSTLLRTLNGLVPHYSGGHLRGRVEIFGRDVTGLPPREVADLVGFVAQDPESHATADRVVTEVCFALENLGTDPLRMRKRVEEVLDQLGLGQLRNRRLDTLSGGERQRVAIAAVLAAQPRVLVCDEPTSSLDPQSAEDVLTTLVRLRDELGLTIVCCEHRLERVAGFADRVCFLPGPARPVITGPPREVLHDTPFAPPVTILGRKLGWEPLPLTVREGRRFARELRVTPPAAASNGSGKPRLSAERLRVVLGATEALKDTSLELRAGELAALVGRNGSGKTTLLRVLVGLTRPQAGRVTIDGQPVGSVKQAARSIAFLPQRADAVLYRDTVRAEIQAAAGSLGAADAWIERLELQDLLDRHPWTLSAGQRLAVAMATVLCRRADIVLLDEPTRGLDPPGKQRLAELLREQTQQGTAVLLVTHDVELVAQAACRVLLLADGRIVAGGPTGDVLGESLLFSSQTSKVMDDARFMTPDDVIAALR